MDEKLLTIKELIRSLKKRWRMIVIITLVATFLSGIISFFIIKPTFEATAKIFIGKDEAISQEYNQNDIMLYQKLLKTYAETIKTNDIVESSLRASNITDLQASSVLGGLTVIPVVDTQIIEIKYKAKSPKEAKGVLESVINGFIKKSKGLVPNGSVKILQGVRTSQNPVSPNKNINIAIAFFISLVGSIGLCFLLEVLGNNFKEEKKLEEEGDTPVVIIKIYNQGDEE